MKKSKISVAIATFNEEENIAACLDSVRQLADEIVVVDGSSTDKTRQVAKKYGAKVIKTDNPSIFHINKQKAIDACQGEWILQLDADERVTSELRDEILQVINNQRPATKDQYAGFWLPRRNWFLGRYLTKGGQYPDYTLRLYRRGKGYLPCKTVHEQAVVKGKVGYLKNDLLHMSDPTFRRYLKRYRRYTGLIADELARRGAKINLVNSLRYLFLKPATWFLSTYFLHKGFVDGYQGFVFSFFSSLRFAVGYIKYLKRKNVSSKN